MKKIRILFVLLAAVLVLSLAACGKSAEEETSEEETEETTTQSETLELVIEETEPETEESHEGQKKSYLTGLWTDEEIVNRRPVAVMLNNIKAALPQTGISKAAVIYEAPVEGMLTRLMGIFEDYDDLDKIGSVRSARTYYVFWSEMWDCIYAHYGQCDYANVYLDQVDNLNGVLGIGTTVYYRTSDRVAPHNAYTSAEGLEAGIAKMGYRTEHEDDYAGGVFHFADEVGGATPQNGTECTYVYPGYNVTSAYFEYDEETQKYLRYEYDAPQIDDMTGEQLAVDNIIIQYCNWNYYYEVTEYLWIDIWSQGAGYYITNGVAVPITWVGGTEYEPTSYYDADGNELVINPGTTWVCTVLSDQAKYTVIE